MRHSYFQSLFFLLSFFSIHSYADQCRVTFPGAVQNNKSNGDIKFEFQSRLINNPTYDLLTYNLIDNSNGTSCDDSPCIQGDGIAVPLSYSSFGNSNSNFSVGQGLTGSLAPGDYKSISLGERSTLTLSPGNYTHPTSRCRVKLLKVVINPDT